MFAALRGWAVGVSEQLHDDVVRRLAARLSEAFKASSFFALDADEDAQRRRRVARVALDVLRINRREERVEIARLRIVGCPGVATHRYRARRLRSAFISRRLSDSWRSTGRPGPPGARRAKQWRWFGAATTSGPYRGALSPVRIRASADRSPTQ